MGPTSVQVGLLPKIPDALLLALMSVESPEEHLLRLFQRSHGAPSNALYFFLRFDTGSLKSTGSSLNKMIGFTALVLINRNDLLTLLSSALEKVRLT